jgi:nitrite reductase/ring-hydroxylating ferredoxin subunit
VDGHDVLLVRSGGTIHALAGRCTHRGGPLADGELVDGCVECPWHGSRFALEDGSVERGPAAFPQPLYETRVRDGRVEVRRAQP